MGTKNLGLPMFTVLRRFSILLTMIGETILLKVQQPFAVRFCVFIMILGSMVAALNDLAFNWLGYTCITVNNLATAANNCYTKKKLESKELGKFGMLFYNSLFTLPCAAYLVYYGGSDQSKNGFVEIFEFTGWNDGLFLAYGKLKYYFYFFSFSVFSMPIFNLLFISEARVSWLCYSTTASFYALNTIRRWSQLWWAV